MTVGGPQSRARRPARGGHPHGAAAAGTVNARKVVVAPINRDRNDESQQPQHPQVMTIYERMTQELQTDLLVQKEVALGKRVGFYRILGHLGSGNFSQVKLAKHGLTEEKVAIKILDKTKMDAKTQRLLSREVSAMERQQHPSCIRLYEVIESVAKVHLVMEYAPGGELFDRINKEGRMVDNVARSIFRQVLGALQHMHDRHVIHRDLKAENVFFAGPMRVKVGDFGFSTLAKPQQELRTFCGSPPYAAPELFQDDSYRGPQVDAWVLGVLLYFILTGTLPFIADTVGRLKNLILAGEFALPKFVSQAAGDVVVSLLRTDPSQRATLAEVAAAAWLSSESPPPPPPIELRGGLGPRRVASEGDLRADEQEARGDLRRLGIDDRSLEEAAADEASSLRSPIGGAYRILLHRVHRRAQDAGEGSDGESGRRLQASKACSVL